jgi:hypothetical protein
LEAIPANAVSLVAAVGFIGLRRALVESGAIHEFGDDQSIFEARRPQLFTAFA